MALFEGDDLVDITAPDGRTARVPASVAASLGLTPPAQQSFQAPMPPGAATAAPQPAPATAAPPAPDTISGVSPVPLSSAVDAPPLFEPAARPEVPIQNSPDFQVPMPASLEPPPTPAPKGKKGAKPAAAAPQMTPDQRLRATGFGGALDEQRSALADAAGAAIRRAGVQAEAQAEIGAAMRLRNEEQDKLVAKRQREAEEDARAIAQKTAAMEAARKKLASTKIDRSIDHPILAAISLALSGIGSAMKREGTVPALDVLWKSIDRKVAGQMADLEQQGKVIGLMKDEVAQLRENASNRLALNNLMVSAEGEKAARYIEEIMARTSSEDIKARGAEIVAQIREKAAGMTMAAVQAQTQHDQRDRHHRQEMGFKYSSLRENRRQHDNEMQFKREQLFMDTQKAIAAEQARGREAEAKRLAEMEKDNEARGIGNIVTGERLLTKQGYEMIDAAAKLEEQAKAIRAKGALDANDDARVRMLEERASQMRGEANIRHVFRHRDPTQAGRFSEQYTAGQTVLSLVDEIQNLYDEHDRVYFETAEGQAAIQAKNTELLMALKNAWQLGVLSRQDTALIERATGGDPTKGWEIGNIAHQIGLGLGTDPEAFKARLNSIADGVQSQIVNSLRAVPGGALPPDGRIFVRKKKEPPSEAKKAIGELGKPTATAIAEDQRNVGVVQDLTQRVFWRAGQGFENKEAAARRIEESGSLKYFGLTPQQEKAMDTLIGELGKGGKNATDAANMLYDQALTGQTDVAVAAAQALFEYAPERYDALRRQLPLDSPTARRLDTVGAHLPAGGPASRRVLEEGATRARQLGERAIVGDRTAIAELTQLARNGDVQAATVLDNVERIRGTRR